MLRRCVRGADAVQAVEDLVARVLNVAEQDVGAELVAGQVVEERAEQRDEHHQLSEYAARCVLELFIRTICV